MSADLLYDQPQWLILFLFLFALLLAGEGGFRLGRRERPAPNDAVRSQLGHVQGALLGLFALLLGFTFAMSLARFDLRKEKVVQEANAIGTAALRGQLLPPEQRGQVAELFRRYVDVRLSATDRPNLPTPERKALDDKATQFQDQLWLHAMGASDKDPHSISAGLLVEAMNDVIDIKSERDAALANHVPESVLLLLLGFAVLNLGLLGYGNGLAGARSLGTAAILSVLIGLVIVVIVDLDRPGRGMIRVKQSSMIELQKSLEVPTPR